MNNQPFIEYVIVLYARSVITTVIGYADTVGASNALRDSAAQHNAEWAHLFDARGQIIQSFFRSA